YFDEREDNSATKSATTGREESKRRREFYAGWEVFGVIRFHLGEIRMGDVASGGLLDLRG
ncbi:hypothetical protein Droror1_Dr00026544, partial [Drosera rotundifolia]